MAPKATATGYDDAGRLASETRTEAGAYSKVFTYDDNDNRATISVTEGGEES